MELESSILLDDLIKKSPYDLEVIGNRNLVIRGFNDDFIAVANDITWSPSGSNLNKIFKKNISLCVIANYNPNYLPDNITIIYHREPVVLFDKLATKSSFKNKTPYVGENCQIHRTAIIGENVCIGNNCQIGPYVVINDNVSIGDNVIIHEHSTIGTFPYSVNYDISGHMYNRYVFGAVNIEDNVLISAGCIISRGITGYTTIRKGTRLANGVLVGHDVTIEQECCIGAQVAIAGYVSIGRRSVIWAKSGISNRIHIAPLTTILASSIVTKDVTKSGMILCGFPAIDKNKYWRNYANSKSNFIDEI